jgi:hypothetical protein
LNTNKAASDGGFPFIYNFGMRILATIAILAASVFAQQKTPPVQTSVHVNHAYITPDEKTYEAIRNSPIVKKLAIWEERTTHRKDITYTGFYLYGQHTYFEFLKPSDRDKADGSEIAFGVDESGQLAEVKKRAEAAGVKVNEHEITRQFNNKDVPWFTMIEPADKSSGAIGVWTIEYKPTFLNEWNPRKGAKASVKREDVLKRYAQVVKQPQGSKALGDIVAIYFDVPPQAVARSVQDCKVLGWRALGGDTGGICTDGVTTIHIRARSNHSGIAAVRFKLSKEMKPEKYEIGGTILSVNEKTALWNFRGKEEMFPGAGESEEHERD